MAVPIFTRLGLNEPWAINQEYALSYLPLLAQLLKGEKPLMENDNSAIRLENKSFFISPKNYDDDDDDETEWENQNTDLDNAPKGSIAVMRLNGLVVKHSQFCGPRGTLDYAEDVKRIDQDENFIGSIFKIESGGGQAYAIRYLTQVMANRKKPIVVLAGNVLASAAYFIAAYADEIIVDHPRSIIGSIGTMTSIQNIQPALEKVGIEFHEIFASKSILKNKTTRDALAGNYAPYREKYLDPLNEDFISEVKQQRPDIVANETIFQGETFLANTALDLKMIDHLGDMDLAIDRVRILSNESKNNQKTNMKFNNVVALVGVQNATQEQLDQANADLTAEGITNYTIVPESLITESANVTAERDQLTTQLADANTARTTAESNLATANTSLATANARITELEAEVAAAPGATHKPAKGKDEVIQSDEDAEYQALMDALPHNQKADRMLG